MNFLEALFRISETDSQRSVFFHSADEVRARWHYGDCFPSVEECAVPDGADLEGVEH